jgi:hypothetical protein
VSDFCGNTRQFRADRRGQISATRRVRFLRFLWAVYKLANTACLYGTIPPRFGTVGKRLRDTRSSLAAPGEASVRCELPSRAPTPLPSLSRSLRRSARWLTGQPSSFEGHACSEAPTCARLQGVEGRTHSIRARSTCSDVSRWNAELGRRRGEAVGEQPCVLLLQECPRLEAVNVQG